jgi:hypothetical protein
MHFTPIIVALLCAVNVYGVEGPSAADIGNGVDELLIDTSDGYYAKALALLEEGNIDGVDELSSNYSSPVGLHRRSVLTCGWCVAGCQAAWELKKIKTFCTRGAIAGKNSCRRIVCSRQCGGLAAAEIEGTDTEEEETEEIDLVKRLACGQRKIKAEQAAFSRCYVGKNHCVSPGPYLQ